MIPDSVLILGMIALSIFIWVQLFPPGRHY